MDFCNCRKPKPGLILQAARKWKIDLKKSYMVGDTWIDVDAARNANVNLLMAHKRTRAAKCRAGSYSGAEGT